MGLRPWLEEPWFSYPISRPITLRYFNVTILLLGLVYVTSITLINVVAIGYEQIPVRSPFYNLSQPLWYERFMMGQGPKAWNCDASIIKVSEGWPIIYHKKAKEST